MTPIKICHFCDKETAYVPLSVGSPYKPLSPKMLRVHFCQACQAEYVYWSDDGTLSFLHLYTTINDKMYRWTVSESEKAACLSYVEKPGIPGRRANEKIQLLKKLEDHPDLTPQNVAEKIKFILLYM